MKPTLKVGLTHRFNYLVPESQTVQAVFPEASMFQSMPRVFATPFMVGLMEWTCMQLIEPHLDPGEGSLGIHVNFSHDAPTPPGLTVAVDAVCSSVAGKLLSFDVKAHDGFDLIGQGTHQRFVVAWEQFNATVADKARRSNAAMARA